MQNFCAICSLSCEMKFLHPVKGLKSHLSHKRTRQPFCERKDEHFYIMNMMVHVVPFVSIPWRSFPLFFEITSIVTEKISHFDKS